MKAVAVKPLTKNSASLLDMPKPVINDSEALIKTCAVGIDGTDIEINQGAYGEAPVDEDILVIGHEAVGEVEEIGAKVTDLHVGELVVPTVRRGDSSDYQERGIKKAHGFLSEYFKESPANLVKLIPELGNIGPLIEPMSIAQKAIDQALKIQQRLEGWSPENILVLGAGALGLLLTMALRSKGYEVYTFDIADSDSLKAKTVQNTGGKYVGAKETTLEKFANDAGLSDLIFEATGNSDIAFSAVNILSQDGAMCLLGVAGRDHSSQICLGCLNNHIVLGNRVLFGSVSSTRTHFEEAIETAKKVNSQWPGVLNSIITDDMSLTEYGKAFQKKQAYQIKGVIHMDGET